MIAEIAMVGIYIGTWIYQRATREEIKPPKPREFTIPRIDDGAPISLIYGKCRVRSPALAWAGVAQYGTHGFSPAVHQINMHFVLGQGYEGGTHIVHGMWQGDHKFKWGLINGAPGSTQTGDGNFETVILADFSDPNSEYLGGYVETLHGGPSQTVVNDAGVATTYLGLRLLEYWPAAAVSGYRGFISAFLHFGEINAGARWRVGNGNSIPSYSFEVSSHRDTSYPAVGIYARIGDGDTNPMNAAWDMLLKLGIPTSALDMDSFTAAATTLYQEGHGYSRCIDNAAEAAEHLLDLLVQVDGVIYEDPSDGLIKTRLIRNDFDPATIPHITRSNCKDIVNLAMGGHAGVPNRIRLVYADRSRGYLEHSVLAQNPANAVGQDGRVREKVIEMLGISYEGLAKQVAARQLAYWSRPIIKCRALLDRSFVRLTPGQAVKLTWVDPDLATVVMRVGAVDRGTLENGVIAVDLVNDANYTWRGQTPRAPHYGVPGIRLNGFNVR